MMNRFDDDFYMYEHNTIFNPYVTPYPALTRRVVASDERRAHVVARFAHKAVRVRQRAHDEIEQLLVDEGVERAATTLDHKLEAPVGE